MDNNTISTIKTACYCVRQRAQKLAEHLSNLHQADDPEHVHQTRVASRRLRQAFAFYEDCFDAGLLKSWQKCIKNILNSLGDARDLDVQIAFLRQFLDGMDESQKTYRPGIERMLLRWSQKRDQMQGSIVKAEKKFQKKQVLINIHLQTEKMLYLLSSNAAEAQTDDLRQRLLTRAEHFLDDWNQKKASLDDSGDIQGHHNLRIATKKLRYMLEIGEDIMDGRLKALIDSLKQLQTLLGDLHDCDVWRQTIDDFEKQEKQDTKNYFGHVRPFNRMLKGLEWFKETMGKNRDVLFCQVKDYVDQLEIEHCQDTIIETIKEAQISYSNEEQSG